MHYGSIKKQLYLTGLFLRSKRWALHQLKALNKPIMVAYSEGDCFVSRNGIKRVNLTETLILETALHNPFWGMEVLIW